MFSKALTFLALARAAQAHMHLYWPPTLLGDNNPFTPQGKADPKLNYPEGCCGQPQEFNVCKGHLGLLDKPEGQPVATWTAGQTANFTLSGHRIDSPIENPKGSTHAGGSCQVGLSTDKGETFRLLKTWQGNCPPHDNPSIDPSDQVFDFNIPTDVPAGDAVFAWSWINREKEFNMNCASVTIAGVNGKSPQPKQPNKSPKQKQYTLEGCTCVCPSQTWTEGCTCDSCDNPRTKRRNVERKALAFHKRELERAEILNAPLRRAEAIAFTSRPLMDFDIDVPGSRCKSQGDPTELRFPNPGSDVVESPPSDGYDLVEPICE